MAKLTKENVFKAYDAKPETPMDIDDACCQEDG